MMVMMTAMNANWMKSMTIKMTSMLLRVTSGRKKREHLSATIKNVTNKMLLFTPTYSDDC